MRNLIFGSILLLSLVCLAWIPRNTEFTAEVEKNNVIKASLVIGEDAAISWNKMEHDFGAIPQGVPVSYEFEITNTGDQAVKILDVKTSCGCTAAGYSKDAIEPGSSTYLTANYNAKSAGIFSKYIKVYTDVQEEPFKLQIKGEVAVGK